MNGMGSEVRRSRTGRWRPGRRRQDALAVEGLRIIGVFPVVVRDATVTSIEVVMPPVLSRFRVRLQSPDCI
jgi:hypothetical protein